MKLIQLAPVFLLVGVAAAFPPAPFHEIYGIVRDELGTPLRGDATVQILGDEGVVLSAIVDPTQGSGLNYSLKVPMDGEVLAQKYQSTALQPAAPFTLRVLIGASVFVPLEVSGAALNIGESGERTRMDLTLGVDSDGDGIPDAWEEDVISAVDGIDNIDDVTRGGDVDGDGVSNYDEYIAGTYAFDRRASFKLEIVEVRDGFARFRFLSAPGRSYRLESKTGSSPFGNMEFSIDADGSGAGEVFVADRVRFRDIFVVADLASDPSAIFRLHVD